MSYQTIFGTIQKLSVLGFLLGALAWSASASASSFINYHCDCTPNTEGVCACDNMGSYTIEPSGTSKEFRGYCGNSTVRKERVDIYGKKKGTSCARIDTVFGYASASCTNWDPFHSDGISISVRCAIDNPSLVNGSVSAP